MARKFATWYTSNHWKKPSPEAAAAYEKMFGHKPFKLIYDSEDGTLFSKGTYPTKITLDELPSSFVPASIWRLRGYFNAAAIKGVAYRPNLWVNHLFKDDLLYISFDHADIDIDDWGKSYELVLYGWDIVTALAALSVFSSLPRDKIVSLENEVADKVRKYRENFPEEHDCVEEDRFWEILETERKRLQEQRENATK